MSPTLRHALIVVIALGGVGVAVAGAATWLGRPGAAPHPAPDAAKASTAAGVAGSSLSTADGSEAGELSEEVRRQRRAEAQRELARERLQRTAAAEFEPAPVDQHRLTERIRELRVEGAEVSVTGERCEPAPCVTAVRVSGSRQARSEALDAIYMAAVLEAAEADAQPTMQRNEPAGTEQDGDEASQQAFVYFVPNDVSADGSEKMATTAIGHITVLRGG